MTAGDLLAELTRELWSREMPAASSGGRGPHPPTPSPIAHPSARERGRPLPKTQEENGQGFLGDRQESEVRPRFLEDGQRPEGRQHFEDRPGSESQQGLLEDGRGFPLSRGLGVRWERGPGGEAPALPDPDEARRLADLVNEALVEQARRHGVDLS
jgi:hypothetical protein